MPGLARDTARVVVARASNIRGRIVPSVAGESNADETEDCKIQHVDWSSEVIFFMLLGVADGGFGTFLQSRYIRRRDTVFYSQRCRDLRAMM